MIEERKYHKGLEKAIILTVRSSGKNPTLERVVKNYYENLKPDWLQIQKDKNDAEILHRLRVELREGFMKHAVKYFSGDNETGAKLLGMLTESKPQIGKEYTWSILKT